MRFVHFSTHDARGGAAKATLRLHRLLQDHGHTSHLIVRHKQTVEDDSIVEAPISSWRLRKRRIGRLFGLVRAAQCRPGFHFNPDTDTLIDRTALGGLGPPAADIVCLHFVSGFLTAEMIRQIHARYGCPIIWMIMDYEPVTGGCHYPFDCEGYRKRCGNCPQLVRSSETDMSRTVWLRKKNELADLPILFWGGTKPSGQMVRDSSLFGAHVVKDWPVAFDEQVFRPIDKAWARDLLHVPTGKKIVFFGTSVIEDPRKGMSILMESLSLLHARMPLKNGLDHEDVHLLIAGHGRREILSAMPFSYTHVGFLSDELTLALAYQAADVFVCSSIQDSGPMMIPEALMCGTPVVAFRTGSALDLIESGRNGYLCSRTDPVELADGLGNVLAACNETEMRNSASKVSAFCGSSAFMERFISTCESGIGERCRVSGDE